MPSFAFAGPAARDDDNAQANSARLLNCYREPIVSGGKAAHSIKSVLGMSDFVTMPTLFVRDMATIGGVFYVMAGGNLYSVTEAGAATLLGATVSKTGAMIFGDGSNVCTVSDGRYFLWDGSTMSEPTKNAFTAIGSGAFLSNYVILTEQDGRRFMWSDLADASTLPALNFATAEGKDDKILRAIVFGNRLWLMKEESIEVWYVTGQAGADAFSRVIGAGADFGLEAASLVTRSSSAVFFVGSDGRVYQTAGGAPVPIPSPAVETALKQSSPTHCFTYMDEGHEFLCIRFSDRPAWCYDLATGEWHERANGDDNDKWAAEVSAKAFGEWFVGDVTGKVYKLERSNADADSALRRVATSGTLYEGGMPFTLAEVELSARVGKAATEPLVTLQFSRDSGLTWGDEITRGLGAQGEYGKRIRVHALGQFRQATMRISWADANDISFNNLARVEFG